MDVRHKGNEVILFECQFRMKFGHFLKPHPIKKPFNPYVRDLGMSWSVICGKKAAVKLLPVKPLERTAFEIFNFFVHSLV